ncbi:hypothetical protein [Ochrobactrum sp. A-1]|uniref:hypothetical protein n=1 Tax=Ochrobactrum sp. A-1 TaxID=2920940 RepID=UPI001F0AE68A|nr:hypothetical protein [Ochrobactrum sp. A-1]
MTTTDKSHLLRFGYAPGNYWFVCKDCGDKQAVGDKRATRCYACAETLYSQVSSVEAVADKHRAITTLPEEAVKAALDTWLDHEFDGTLDYPRMRNALTAALPFLPVQGAVKKLEWRDVDAACAWCYAQTPIGEYRVTWSFNESGQKLHYPDGTTKQFDGAGYGDRDAAKAAAFQDYQNRILSALEL